ncbi:MAG: DUF4212 domain-containing protein [Chloroflexi bacterium]|nr:MAG: DUF4212 domain-containing protein [Chloroflexota bacterium]
MGEKEREDARRYWQANIRLITILLIIWAVVSYGFAIILAPVLNSINLGQVPLGFWFAQQGSMYVFVILIFVYAKLMDKMDQEHNVQE